MGRVRKVLLVLSLAILGGAGALVAEECAEFIASTDPDFPATGELTQEWCIDAGVSTTVFSMDICTVCGCIYDVETEAGETIVQTTELDCAWNAD